MNHLRYRQSTALTAFRPVIYSRFVFLAAAIVVVATAVSVAAAVADQKQNYQDQNPSAAIAAEKASITHTVFPPFILLITVYGKTALLVTCPNK